MEEVKLKEQITPEEMTYQRYLFTKALEQHAQKTPKNTCEEKTTLEKAREAIAKFTTSNPAEIRAEKDRKKVTGMEVKPTKNGLFSLKIMTTEGDKNFPEDTFENQIKKYEDYANS
jgi:hypothetical protein